MSSNQDNQKISYSKLFEFYLKVNKIINMKEILIILKIMTFVVGVNYLEQFLSKKIGIEAKILQYLRIFTLISKFLYGIGVGYSAKVISENCWTGPLRAPHAAAEAEQDSSIEQDSTIEQDSSTRIINVEASSYIPIAQAERIESENFNDGNTDIPNASCVVVGELIPAPPPDPSELLISHLMNGNDPNHNDVDNDYSRNCNISCEIHPDIRRIIAANLTSYLNDRHNSAIFRARPHSTNVNQGNNSDLLSVGLHSNYES